MTNPYKYNRFAIFNNKNTKNRTGRSSNKLAEKKRIGRLYNACYTSQESKVSEKPRFMLWAADFDGSFGCMFPDHFTNDNGTQSLPPVLNGFDYDSTLLNRDLIVRTMENANQVILMSGSARQTILHDRNIYHDHGLGSSILTFERVAKIYGYHYDGTIISDVVCDMPVGYLAKMLNELPHQPNSPGYSRLNHASKHEDELLSQPISDKTIKNLLDLGVTIPKSETSVKGIDVVYAHSEAQLDRGDKSSILRLAMQRADFWENCLKLECEQDFDDECGKEKPIIFFTDDRVDILDRLVGSISTMFEKNRSYFDRFEVKLGLIGRDVDLKYFSSNSLIQTNTPKVALAGT